MAETYAIPRNTAGLNNLKMAVFGIRQIASRDSESYRLPTELFDFTPTPDGISGDYLPLDSVFDSTALDRFFIDASSTKETKRVSNADCIEIVGRTLASELGNPSSLHNGTAEAFSSFAAAPALRREAQRIRSCLPASVCALQLRIERDWQEYAGRKGWKAGTVAGGCEIVLDHKRIFHKIAETEAIPKTIFACCDEDDLTVSRKEILRGRKRFGLDLAFKSDFASPISSRLMRSVVDFDLCLSLPFYVGLPRSTFSNILCVVRAHLIDGNPDHFVFDAESERCERRHDLGRATNAAAAIARR